MAKRKNLIFCFADQWRRDSVGFVDEDVITPNIDKLSYDSKVFLNAVTTGPLCSPSRASILTGTYPITHGVFTNCKLGLNDVYLKDQSITITDVLHENSYYIGYIGKWHLDSPDLNTSKNPESKASGWDKYTPPGKARHNIDYWYSYGAYDDHLKPHYWENSSKMIEIDEWSPKHETRKAIEFIEKNKDKDFALFVSYNPPHTPLDLVPDKFLDMYKNKTFKVRENVVLQGVIDHPKSMDKSLEFTESEYQDTLRKYYAAITGVDYYLGKLIKYLKDSNLYDDCIIVLTADHGEMLCSHGLWSKHVWYEESIGVPFLVKYDKSSIGITDEVLSGVDIMPTLLSLLELKIPKEVEGKDLKNVVLSNKKTDNKAIVACYPGQVSAISKFREKNLNFLNYGFRAVRSKTHTFVINKGYAPNEKEEILLYDNINDKYQLNPIKLDKNTKNEIADNLKKYLNDWLKEYKDGFEI